MKSASLATLLAVTLLLGACATENAAPVTSAGLVNTTCPLTGESLSANSPSSEFQGKKVGFCCKKCKAKFDAMDDAAKTAEVAKVK